MKKIKIKKRLRRRDWKCWQSNEGIIGACAELLALGVCSSGCVYFSFPGLFAHLVQGLVGQN